MVSGVDTLKGEPAMDFWGEINCNVGWGWGTITTLEKRARQRLGGGQGPSKQELHEPPRESAARGELAHRGSGGTNVGF